MKKWEFLDGRRDFVGVRDGRERREGREAQSQQGRGCERGGRRQGTTELKAWSEGQSEASSNQQRSDEQSFRSNFKFPILEPGKLPQPLHASRSFGGACNCRRAAHPRSPPELPAGEESSPATSTPPLTVANTRSDLQVEHAVEEQLREQSLEEARD